MALGVDQSLLGDSHLESSMCLQSDGGWDWNHQSFLIHMSAAWAGKTQAAGGGREAWLLGITFYLHVISPCGFSSIAASGELDFYQRQCAKRNCSKLANTFSFF